MTHPEIVREYLGLVKDVRAFGGTRLHQARSLWLKMTREEQDLVMAAMRGDSCETWLALERMYTLERSSYMRGRVHGLLIALAVAVATVLLGKAFQ